MADDTEENQTPTTVVVGNDNSEAGVLTEGHDIVELGGGNDHVSGQQGVNIIDGGSGDDASTNFTPSGNAWDVVMGGSGDDYIVGPGRGFLNARGGTGKDVIIGGLNKDYIFGDEGQDVLIGGGGDDYIVGGADDDVLLGGTGADTFVFGKGDGNDTIFDFEVIDIIDLTPFGGTITWEQIVAKFSTNSDGISTTIDLSEWGGGTITLLGFNKESLTKDMFKLPTGEAAYDPSEVFQDPDVNSVHMGTSGDDVIDLKDSTGGVQVTGGEGDDVITGGSGGDILMGGEGTDTLKGNAGDDTLMGGEGGDILEGGAGKDWLIGGVGDDTMTGGTESDTFIFREGHGNDTITDFTANEDMINLVLIDGITTYDQLNISQDGKDTVIDLTSFGGGKITLSDFNMGDLDADDFTFYIPPAGDTDSI